MKGKFIAYYRVSTDRQGKSGLGLEAQQKAVMDYLNGGAWTLVGEFTEVESGKRGDRPELAKAMALCKKHKATLVIAKLDRLSRNVAFIANLMEATGSRFVAADIPNAPPLELHMRAAFAEEEGRAISARTRAALQAAKARGVKLGRHGAETLAPRYQQEALQRATALKPMLREMLDAGSSFSEIAKRLADRKIPTPRGGTWHRQMVSRVMKRLELS